MSFSVLRNQDTSLYFNQNYLQIYFFNYEKDFYSSIFCSGSFICLCTNNPTLRLPFMTLGVKNGASIVLDLSLLNAGTLYINPGNGEYETMDIQNTQWTGDKTIVAKGETITLHGNINKFYANSNGENLNAIDVTRLLDLEWLELDGNNLSEINVDQNKKLARLYFSWNKVKELNIDGYPNLLRFYCRHNEMTSLTLGNTPKLYTAYCDGNLLDACALDDLYTSLSDGTAQYEKTFLYK